MAARQEKLSSLVKRAGKNDEILGDSPALAEQNGRKWPDRQGREGDIAPVH
jgi:hypothetical protein